jgi:hypothetical protein
MAAKLTNIFFNKDSVWCVLEGPRDPSVTEVEVAVDQSFRKESAQGCDDEVKKTRSSEAEVPAD